MFGNRIEEIPLESDEQIPPTCFSAMTSRGEPCSLCVDSTGAVVENTCETGSNVDALPRDEEEPSGDTHVVVLQEIVDRAMVGAEVFVASFNAALRQAGIEATLPAPGDELLFRDFSEGEITISEPSCADVMGYLSDARCRPWELLSLDAVGIDRISLDATVVDVRDEHGNELGLEASARTVAGRSAPVFDVWFVLGGTVDLGTGPSAGIVPE
jgi:hypothetical protein